MTYKGWDIKWRVFDYNMEEDSEETVKVYNDPVVAAIYCIEHKHAGVEMIAFPMKKGGVRI